MNLAETSIIIEVQFYDLDPMSVVWHGNYVKYLESVRCKLFEQIGYTYANIQQDGYLYPIAKMDMKFIKSATLSQKLVVKAFLEEIEPALKIKYIIQDYDTNEIIFKATTMQICVEKSSQKSIYEAPEKLKEGLKCLR